uniref:Guanyl-specific ribonuclease Sa n=1 Tax=bacterium enrichment culture TaxID=207831 RepID=A0A0R7N6I6_9BACT|nr:guanyl-specific ribonuclease Sa [bacterium enrichment culture]
MSDARRRLSIAPAVCIWLFAAAASSAAARTGPDGIAEVRLGSLPPEAREVHAAIVRGGPFRYERDGVAFGNREKMLPARPRGYYHEYTVPTPGVKTRGARRIVCGGAAAPPEICYYTDDHYQSFRRIRE